MKKLYSLLLLATALTANAQQIPNGNFERDWEKRFHLLMVNTIM